VTGCCVNRLSRQRRPFVPLDGIAKLGGPFCARTRQSEFSNLCTAQQDRSIFTVTPCVKWKGGDQETTSRGSMFFCDRQGSGFGLVPILRDDRKVLFLDVS
jgi:hypothetical protein